MVTMRAYLKWYKKSFFLNKRLVKTVLIEKLFTSGEVQSTMQICRRTSPYRRRIVSWICTGGVLQRSSAPWWWFIILMPDGGNRLCMEISGMQSPVMIPEVVGGREGRQGRVEGLGICSLVFRANHSFLWAKEQKSKRAIRSWKRENHSCLLFCKAQQEWIAHSHFL